MPAAGSRAISHEQQLKPVFGSAIGSPPPVRAEPVALADAMTAAQALREVGRGGLAHLRGNERAALAGDPEAVHQMRVALRRLRSAVAAFEPMLPRAESRRVRRELAALGKPLGVARNLDVLANDLLAPGRAALLGEADFAALAAAVERRRRAARRGVQECLASPEYEAAVARLRDWFEAADGDESGTAARTLGEAAPRLLDRLRRDVERRGKGFRRLSPKERHKLRIAVKKLRYALELFAGLCEPRQLSPVVRRLKRLQDDLGYQNDVEVGRALIAGLGGKAAAAGAPLLAWHERRLAEREARTGRRLRRLTSAKPPWRKPAGSRPDRKKDR